MFEDGNTIEEGNLSACLYMCCEHTVLNTLPMSTKKTWGLKSKFFEFLFSNNNEGVSMQNILQAKPIKLSLITS